MSDFYGKFWIATKAELDDLVLREKFIENSKPETDRTYQHRIIASLYARYVKLCNNLEELDDQTLQVQKRPIVRRLLEASVQRLLELEKELKNIELSEFVYIDDTVKEMHLVPHEIQVLRPYYFTGKHETELRSFVDAYRVAQYVKQQEEIKERVPAAIKLIIIHEKARQKRRILNTTRKSQIAQMKNKTGVEYEFYHKPDTYPLFPVKKTRFTTNFCISLHDLSNYSFYEPPEHYLTLLQKESRKVMNLEFNFDSKKKIQIPTERKVSKIPAQYAVVKCATAPKRKAKFRFDIELPDEESDESIEELIPEVKSEEKNYNLFKLKSNIRAAALIQRSWKRWRLKQLEERELERRLVFLGMMPGEPWDRSIYQQIEMKMEKRRAKKPGLDEQFVKAIMDEEARIVRVKNPFIMEDISDHIRAWFRECYDGAGTFDVFPEEYDGGTILVIRGETKTIEELRNPKKKEKKKKAKKEKKKKSKKKKGPQPSKALIDLNQTLEDYEREWYGIDEMANIDNAPIMEFITTDIMAKTHIDLRQQVDVYMRTEHELLLLALAKDQKKKRKKRKGKKKKKKKGKKKRKGKKKKKQPVDKTGDRTTESLYEELAQQNIIRPYSHTVFDDFIGDINITAFDKRLKNENPIHCTGEIRQILRNTILGMGPLNVNKAKSLCLAGPPLTGKKFLVNAMCTDMDAVLFDLSPKNTKDIENVPDFLQLILKMARLLQPSVIFFNNVHRVFYKKVPKDEKDDKPTKLKKVFKKKLIKAIAKTDKIMVLATTNEPWRAAMRGLKKCFERIVLLPKPDYGCTFLAWQTGFAKQTCITKFMDVSSLAYVTQGLTIGQILHIINQVLNLRRRLNLHKNPIEVEEFLEAAVQTYPIVKDFSKYIKWYEKANVLAKKRKKMLKQIEKAQAKGKDKNKKGKK